MSWAAGRRGIGLKPMQINSLVAVGLGAVFATGFAAVGQADDSAVPVNTVEISDLLSTSGQPPAAYFEVLAEQGFEIIVNLAPPQSHGSLQDEGGLVGEKGMTYVNIPVDWNGPEREQFEFFARLLSQNQARKTLVHCQVGFRASTFTFLYRVIYLEQPADEALEFVHQVWVPNDTWTEFANEMLQANGVDFRLQND